MIKRFFVREVEFLLEEFDAPDVRTLLLRAAFWTYVTIFTTIVLFGLVAIGNMFGLEWMAAAVIIIILLCVRLTRRAPLYIDGPLMLGGDKPALPPPGKQALPPPGTRALTSTVRSGTGRKALPPR